MSAADRDGGGNATGAGRGHHHPTNLYFAALKRARDASASQFRYKGRTYVRGQTSTGLVVYRRAGV